MIISDHPAFEKLRYFISERIKPGADKSEVDKRIKDMFGEKAAIMFTDLSGFSRGVAEFGIIHFLQILFESQKLFSSCVNKYDGLILKTEGDSLLIVFKELKRAVECAIEMQRSTYHYNLCKIDAEKILLCVGLGYGDCLKIGDTDIYGAEVNAASKLGEDTAGAWEILATSEVKKALEADQDFVFEKIDVIPSGSRENAYKLIYTI